MDTFAIRPLTALDQAWLPSFFETHWGSTRQVVRGAIFIAHESPGFVAEADGTIIGPVTYRLLDEQTGEVATLNSLRVRSGIGSALIQTVIDAVRNQGCTRLVVVTTNDNLHALCFYQKRGFVLALLRPNALAAARLLKPEIPLIGFDDIPLRDEIELAMSWESRDG